MVAARTGVATVTTILGIDPGATGAIAVLYDTGAHNVWDMPTNPHDLYGLLETIIREAGRANMAYLERAQAMPKQGVVSMFNYGVGYGQILGILAACSVPYTLVAPGVWKRALGLTGKPKDASRVMARQLFPAAPLGRGKDHGRAEALLIAEWGRRQG